MDIADSLLDHLTDTFRRQKRLADRAIAQLAPTDFDFVPDAHSNSIAIIMKHMAGNMRSRWTDFLTSDGEKPTRNRDAEFSHEGIVVAELITGWEEGWQTLFSTLSSLTPEDLGNTVTIRGQEHTALEAILRQLDHYGQHVGQIVYLAKHIRGDAWQNLSIPTPSSANQDVN